MQSTKFPAIKQGEYFMDFDQAIQAHVEWKAKLAAYIAKPDIA